LLEKSLYATIHAGLGAPVGRQLITLRSAEKPRSFWACRRMYGIFQSPSGWSCCGPLMLRLTRHERPATPANSPLQN